MATAASWLERPTDRLAARRLLPPYWAPPAQVGVATPPAFDEEYCEWIDVLEAVQAAYGRFTMIEFGAGYSRWASRTWTAARQRGLAAHVGGA